MPTTDETACYLVAGTKPWNRRVFEARLAAMPGDWTFVATPTELNEALAAARGVGRLPRYIFFLHWSHLVPAAIVDEIPCVCFHMTDVPFGRGGSPLQNLIERGHSSTQLTALRMDHGIDDGPVYAKRDLDLHGTAEEVLVRAGELSVDLVAWIIAEDPEPIPQEGEPVVFARRTPEQSRIDATVTDSLGHLYDFIRMLDGEGYPRAFLEHEGLRIELSRAGRYDGRLVVDAVITLAEEAS